MSKIIMEPISYEDKNTDLITKRISDKLKIAMDMNEKAPGGIHVFKAIEFILDRFNSGSLYGIIALKFLGTICHNPKILDQTFRLEEKYEE